MKALDKVYNTDLEASKYGISTFLSWWITVTGYIISLGDILLPYIFHKNEWEGVSSLFPFSPFLLFKTLLTLPYRYTGAGI